MAAAEFTKEFGGLDVGAEDLDLAAQLREHQIELPTPTGQRAVARLQFRLLLF